jgi:hypothetical protein
MLGIMPLRHCPNVDFPEPEGPMIKTFSLDKWIVEYPLKLAPAVPDI